MTREDLAEQAVDDLGEIAGLDAARAAKLIMAARSSLVRARAADEDG